VTATGAVWRNWSRGVTLRPRRVERPTSPEAVQRAVIAAASAGLPVKAVGTGHSFSGIALAPGVQLDLHDLQLGSGITGSAGGTRHGGAIVDIDRRRITVAAGTPLYRLPGLLAPHGLALTNLGGIDRQTIAGATATGSHGTGGSFGGLAAQIMALTLVTGDGSLLTVSETENPELLPAVRLGLGALGIIVDITMQCVPAFLVHQVEAAEPLDAVLDDYLRRSAALDHFSFNWFPHTGSALTRSATRLPADTARAPLGRATRWFGDELLANGVRRATSVLGAAAPLLVPVFSRVAEKRFSRREYTDAPARAFVTNHAVRFNEMEYALPRDAVPEALREVRALVERRGWRISFPVEVSAAAADDLWLSTAHGRESGYIAVRRYFREDPDEYFTAVEAIMRAHDGRPHWGTMHKLGADTLRGLYPRFDDFRAARDRLDPERRFGNSYLERVLGP
jgi:FAD-linked oxidoreductase